MSDTTQPLSAKEILDASFLENRARILEIAAFLDRIDRAPDAGVAKEDFRYRSLRQAIALVLETGSRRAKAVQLSFSDLSVDPVESAKGLKAVGAWEGACREGH